MNDLSSGPPGVLPDHEIERLGIVTPFLWGEKRTGIISYGATAYGYDVRASNEPFRVFSNVRHPGRLVDPKRISSESFEEVAPTTDETGSWVAIPPNSYALCSSLEYLRIPRDVIAFCVGKSTLARSGLIVNVTPLEPEWHGQVTIEISNSSPLPAKVYCGEGVMQVNFHRVSLLCRTSYGDKGGIYQGQTGITLARVVQE